MCHPWLSLAIIIALLFTYVIASPLPSGNDKGTRSHSSKSCTSNHGALGKHHAPGSGSHGGPVGERHSTSNVRTGPGARLNTLEMMRSLESAGIPQAQAKVLTEAVSSHFKSHDTAVKLDMSDITRIIEKVGIPKEKAEVVKEAIDQSQE